LTVSEQVTLGKSARKAVPRSRHAVFAASSDRPSPVATLKAQDGARVPELVPIRYGRMLESPFAFYRGGAAIMARDLAETPRSGLTVQCCGDAHLSNFGVFASPDRRLVFDINDFDETLPGPWEWDVKRLAVSLVVAARDNGHSVAEQEEAALKCVRRYREAMHEFAGMTTMDVWHSRLEVETELERRGPALDRASTAAVEKDIAKARARDSMSALAKLTHSVDGRPRIIDQSPLIVPVDQLAGQSDRADLFSALESVMAAYAETLEHDRRVLLDQFTLADFARKVVGVGSVGTRSWIALLLGRDDDEPLFMQIKEANASVLEPYLAASEFANHGERVVVGQRLMQAASDILLGWMNVEKDLDGQSRDYYARQLRDWKGSVDVDQMSAGEMVRYGNVCGWTLARAHARSGDRLAIAAYLGNGDRFDRALSTFSTAYADQNQRDYDELIEAAASGQVAAQKD
jgi:uncharacterized protein (DUF2252 family)